MICNSALPDPPRLIAHHLLMATKTAKGDPAVEAAKEEAVEEDADDREEGKGETGGRMGEV
jgi:hypothetical protein